MSAVSTGPRVKARAGGHPAEERRRWLQLARRAAWRLPESREHRLAVIGLAALLVAGALLRLLFIFAWRPAFMGWPDAASYIDVSQGELFGNTLRPAGYPLFLRALHALVPSLQFVIIVQHVLGLATAALFYLAVARAGAPRLLGLVPAGIVALGGDIMFVEHAPISETLFTFLVAIGLYAAVRSQEGERHRGWPQSYGASTVKFSSPLTPLSPRGAPPRVRPGRCRRGT